MRYPEAEMDKVFEHDESMQQDAASPIESVDLQNMSIDDVRRVNNPVLREALLAAKEKLQVELSSSHTSHGTHTNHLKSMTDSPL